MLPKVVGPSGGGDGVGSTVGSDRRSTDKIEVHYDRNIGYDLIGSKQERVSRTSKWSKNSNKDRDFSLQHFS